jgi:hypothetical protein
MNGAAFGLASMTLRTIQTSTLSQLLSRRRCAPELRSLLKEQLPHKATADVLEAAINDHASLIRPDDRRVLQGVIGSLRNGRSLFDLKPADAPGFLPAPLALPPRVFDPALAGSTGTEREWQISLATPSGCLQLSSNLEQLFVAGNEGLQVVSRASGEVEGTLPGSGSVSCGPKLSPDGLRAFYVTGDRQLLAADTSERRALWTRPWRNNASFILGHDGKQLFLHDPDDDGESGELQKLDAATGKVLWAQPCLPGAIGDPVLSPDGKLLVYSTGKGIAAVDASDGRLRWEGAFDGQQTFPGEGAFSPDGRRFFAPKGKGVIAFDTAGGQELWRSSSGLELSRQSSLVLASPDGSKVFSCATSNTPDHTLEAFDAATGKALSSTRLMGPIHFAPDGLSAIAVTGNCKFQRLDFADWSLKPLGDQRAPTRGEPSQFALSPDGKWAYFYDLYDKASLHARELKPVEDELQALRMSASGLPLSNAQRRRRRPSGPPASPSASRSNSWGPLNPISE